MNKRLWSCFFPTCGRVGEFRRIVGCRFWLWRGLSTKWVLFSTDLYSSLSTAKKTKNKKKHPCFQPDSLIKTIRPRWQHWECEAHSRGKKENTFSFNSQILPMEQNKNVSYHFLRLGKYNLRWISTRAVLHCVSISFTQNVSTVM